MTEGKGAGWAFLRTPRWFGYFALFITFSVACVMFGNWQFDRRAQAQAEIARIDTNYDAEAVPLAEAVPDPTRYDEDRQKWHPVTVRGVYQEEPFLIRGRPGPGGVGSALIQPLTLESGEVFFVDRGWVPVAGVEELPDDLPEPPAGTVIVEARLRGGEPPIAGRSAVGRLYGSVELEQLASAVGAPASSYTGVYGQLVEERDANGTLLTDTETGSLAQRPERTEGPHLSYALQWYVFIVLAGIGVVYAARQEHRSLNAGTSAAERADQRRDRRAARGRLSDAEEEDALLDAQVG